MSVARQKVCAMDAFALLALIPDDEPSGGVRKRKRSCSAQGNRSSTRHATVSDQSEGMNAVDILALIPSCSRPVKLIRKSGMGHAAEDWSGTAATCACAAVHQVWSGNQA